MSGLCMLVIAVVRLWFGLSPLVWWLTMLLLVCVFLWSCLDAVLSLYSTVARRCRLVWMVSEDGV